MNSDEIFLTEALQTGKTLTLMGAIRRKAERDMLFIGTPTGVKAIQADPKAAERAKRYLWSCIGQTQKNDWRAK